MAVIRLGQAARNRQAEASLRQRRLAQRSGRVRRRAGATGPAIADLESHDSGTGQRGELERLVRGCGAGGVLEQVHQDLQHQGGIDLEVGAFRRDLRDDLAAGEYRGKRLAGSAEQACGGCGFGVRASDARFETGHGEQVVDAPRQARLFALQRRERRRGGFVAADLAPQRRQLEPHRGQRRAQIVGDRAQQRGLQGVALPQDLGVGGLLDQPLALDRQGDQATGRLEHRRRGVGLTRNSSRPRTAAPRRIGPRRRRAGGGGLG